MKALICVLCLTVTLVSCDRPRGENQAGTHSQSAAANGYSLMMAGRPEDAIRVFDEVLHTAADPDVLWRTFSWRAIAFSMKGRFDDALRDCSRSLEFNPPGRDAGKIYLFRGILRLRLCDKVAALGDFDEAVRLAPQDVEVLAGTALFSFLFKGHYREVLKTLDAAEEVARHGTKNVRVNHLRYVYEKRAEIALELQRDDEATRELRVAAEWGSSLSLKRIAGRLALRRGDVRHATECALAALALSPNDPEAHKFASEVRACGLPSPEKVPTINEVANALSLIPYERLLETNPEKLVDVIVSRLPKSNCDSEHAVALVGMLLYVQGRQEDAINYLMRSIRERSYPTLAWSILIIGGHEDRIQTDAWHVMQAQMEMLPEDLWYWELAQFAAGKIDSAKLQAHIESISTEFRSFREGELCYVEGEKLVRGSTPSSAMEKFRRASELTYSTSFAHVLALARIRQSTTNGVVGGGSDLE